ncbi:malic acid transport protein [Daldinia decipiens]|uniref:malic acid transport protein n=1 Tax=Daldinia decipiens TaxID=326647 RepID=UPI0020C59794|nr:malic acid transport protein [Daldinia decipiens]KAI1660496.1 malic acid transport protein [Daldinia decipiens]
MERTLLSRENISYPSSSTPPPPLSFRTSDPTEVQFPVDEKNHGGQYGQYPGTQASSAANSIYESKENHAGDLEHGTHEHGHDHVDMYDPNRPKLGLRQRMHHFTWAWFTLPMSTGGLSLLIFAQTHQFPGLRQIGLFVYIVNLILFTTLTFGMLSRFFLHHGDFYKSLSHPREGFFFPTYFLSVATIITSTQRYAIPDNDTPLVWAIQFAFWGYVVITLIVAIGQYSFVFAAHNFGLQTMMPTWILPIFPIMLSGTIASVISDTQPEISAIPILIAGMSCQGLGLFVAIMMYAHMIGRLMSAGLPNREHRPGLFMNVGPPAFTALAFIGMANGLPDTFDREMDGFIDVHLIRTFAMIGAIFLWALSLWWFGIALIAVLSSPPKYFHLGWWAMVFPNTGFILATISISNEFGNETVKWVTTAMSICLLATYLFVLYSHVRAVIVQDIMYPGRDEDFEDH